MRRGKKTEGGSSFNKHSGRLAEFCGGSSNNSRAVLMHDLNEVVVVVGGRSWEVGEGMFQEMKDILFMRRLGRCCRSGVGEPLDAAGS